MTRRVAFVVALAALLTVAPTPAAPRAAQVPVFFVQGEQLARVARPGATVQAAVRQLLSGPTRAERTRGFRTYVPSGTTVHKVDVANGLATIDLSNRFTSGAAATLAARLSQLVRTATGLQGTTRVRLLIDGNPVSGVFPGIKTESPITFRDLQKPDRPLPTPPAPRLPAPDPQVKVVQRMLIKLGYLLAGQDDGRFGPVTSEGVLAFQKWERLDRTGVLDAKTKARLKTAVRPSPITQGAAGKRAEIALDRQIALLIRDNEVVRTIAVSSGKPSTPTPPGAYKVYAKIERWWSTPFREWLPWALPFVGGIAFHEFGDVPVFPASHGCVRQPFSVARWTYDFADIGMPVLVLART